MSINIPRKRTFISIIITIIILILLNKFWLIVKPINVEFDILNGTKGFIEAQLNKNDDNKFRHYKAAKQEVSSNHYKLNVKRAKSPKRFRLMFIDFPQNQSFIIKNIKIKNKELNNSDKFYIKNARFKIEGNSIIIAPENNISYLYYDEKLNIKPSIRFEFEIFIIIMFLTFLLSYKFTDYLADYSSIKKQSRLDIVFLLIFFILLFVPMSKISKENISQSENRTLATFKPLILKDYKINYDFGKNFESFFSDRFFLREKITSFYKKLKIAISYKISVNNNIYYNKKTGWAFMPSWFNVPDISSDIPEIKENIQNLYDFCKEQNIKLYIVIVPVKEEVYPDKIEPYILKQKNGEIFVQTINKNISNIAYFPVDILKEKAKTDYTYPKSDPHWTEYGAYIAVNDFLRHFGYKLLNENDFEITKQTLPLVSDYYDMINPNNSGYYYNVLGIVNKIDYKHYTFKNNDNFITIHTDNILLSKDTYYKNAKNPQKVYFICTSYGENFWLFLRYAFQTVIKRRNNNFVYNGLSLDFNRWKKEIIKEKPDILIILTESNYLDKYKNMWEDKN